MKRKKGRSEIKWIILIYSAVSNRMILIIRMLASLIEMPIKWYCEYGRYIFWKKKKKKCQKKYVFVSLKKS